MESGKGVNPLLWLFCIYFVIEIGMQCILFSLVVRLIDLKICMCFVGCFSL